MMKFYINGSLPKRHFQKSWNVFYDYQSALDWQKTPNHVTRKTGPLVEMKKILELIAENERLKEELNTLKNPNKKSKPTHPSTTTSSDFKFLWEQPYKDAKINKQYQTKMDINPSTS